MHTETYLQLHHHWERSETLEKAKHSIQTCSQYSMKW